MESGTVKWLDKAKGYGCISRENGEELLVPISTIQASGLKNLKPGEAVQFDIIMSEEVGVIKGWQANFQEQKIVFHHGDVAKQISATERVSREIPADTKTSGHEMLRSIRKSLGIRGALKSDADLVALVEERLPVTAISALMEHGVLEKEIYAVIIPRRTLQHRRTRKEKLSREESDRAIRLARLVTLTENVFGDHDSGMHWLRSPKKRFHGRSPMAMMETEAGSRLVEEALYQIDEGMAA